MLVSEAWLREFVSPRIDAKELAERLTMGGLEVESMQPAAPSLHKKRVIVGRIIASRAHANAPRLQVCEVEVGSRAALSIVCGAANVKAGCTVAVALIGAKLPGGEVRAREIAGVKSEGMICSASELGLSEQSDGVMLLDDEAQNHHSLGASLSDYLALSDTIFELTLTPNRGDCLGILGVAREVAALTGATMQPLRIKKNRAVNASHLPIALRAPRACPRYVGRAVRNVDLAARTPDWMAERLRRSGARSVNIAVDITNYVMLELGQPMHAFDLDKLHGGIVVRMAKPREKLRLLDGSTVKLERDHLVIADRKSALALGGIMGGYDSAISSATRHVYLEAAFFPAAHIIGKARRLGMHTDASHRFERGVDPAMQAQAMERATQLLVAIAGGEPGPVSDEWAREHVPRPLKIKFNPSEITRLLGASVPSNRVRTMLTQLGMRVSAGHASNMASNKTSGKTSWSVTVPSWRSDLSGAHDLVEEVGRIHGFDHIAPRPPLASATVGGHPENQISTMRIKQKLVERGYFEAITYSFVDGHIQRALTDAVGIKVRNPMADNLAVMRRSLWPGLLDAVKTNLNRQHERVRLFETGNVFLKDHARSARREVHRVAAVASGSVLPKQWGEPSRAVDFFDIKGDLLALLALSEFRQTIQFHHADHHATHPALHPGRSAQIKLGKDCIGHLGQLHPDHQKLMDIDQSVYLFELDWSFMQKVPLPSFSAVSRYPAVRRDLAVVVESDVEAQDVLNVARSAAGNLLVDLELFDIYQGKGIEKNHKSFAFRLTFQSESSNLTAGEVDAKTVKIMEVLQRQLGARLRT